MIGKFEERGIEERGGRAVLIRVVTSFLVPISCICHFIHSFHVLSADPTVNWC